MKSMIVIPARYGSKRFPGKPLAKLAGKEILLRVYETAVNAATGHANCEVMVATEEPEAKGEGSAKIVEFCLNNDIPVMTTPSSCRSGSDRVWQVAQSCSNHPDILINLQGDNPLCPPEFIDALLTTFEQYPDTQVATAYTRLNWEKLNALRQSKIQSPFSGTTVIVGTDGNAKWFSKNIIPAIRNEEKLLESSPISPVCRHIGLYGYSYNALKVFSTTEAGYYEQLEQLEQLRFLENNIPVRMVEVTYPAGSIENLSGIDSIADLEKAEQLLSGVRK